MEAAEKSWLIKKKCLSGITASLFIRLVSKNTLQLGEWDELGENEA